MSTFSDTHFEVHPSVVYQLGESLISDAVQALIELVKNCYDADATYAKVVIDTKEGALIDGTIYPPEGGRIIVEDDGHGMNLESIRNGWLTISNRRKRELKQSRRTTPGGRTPLGDKGLGRLGVQRLGVNLEIFTKTADDKAYHFGFSWLDFETAPRLEGVDIHLEESDLEEVQGTRVVISDLKEPHVWRGQSAIKRLEQELSRMISPYRKIRDFTVLVIVDGKALHLVEASDQAREIAPIRYDLDFDGKQLTINGRAKIDFFRPSKPKDAEDFSLFVESDGGKSFLEFLMARREANLIGLRRASSDKWFVEFSVSRKLEDLDKLEHTHGTESKVANPGPFTGEVDSFDLGSTAFQHQSIFDRMSEFRSYVKDLSGIRVYRDGFAIRVDGDWLKLGAQWTSAKSYYGLKPDNTLGYIALSARENMDLEEKTDREGFKDSPYYRNFAALLDEFKAFSSRAQNFLGRSASDYRKARSEVAAKVDSRRTVEELSRVIKSRINGSRECQTALDEFKTRLSLGVKASRELVSTLSTTQSESADLKEMMAKVLQDLEPMLAEGESVVEQITSYLGRLEEVTGLGQVLEDRVESLREQMEEMYDTVALGLTAEALSHEVYNVADHLAGKASALRRTILDKRVSESSIRAFIEYVQTSVAALRKQMSFLAPSMRYVRETKDEIDILKFVGELEEFYRGKLEAAKIRISSVSMSKQDFVVRLNKGKLMQVFDNLVRNSEYWLKEDISQGRIERGEISIQIDRPFVRVSDSGRGIDPGIEAGLFEPFVSAKAKGQGRGLGLFISKQLLDGDGCSVGVVPERNDVGRLFKFQVDLRGALV